MIKEGQVPPESQFIPSDIFKDVYETTDPVTLEKIVEPKSADWQEFCSWHSFTKTRNLD